MSNVVSLADHRPDNWAAGEARCTHCRHEWNSVFPLPLRDSLECPSCGLFQGWPKYPIMDTDNETLSCDCGGYTFVIRRQGDVLCTHCGALRDFPEA